MLPQLRGIEHRFAHEVVTIGVHSGKYIAERETERIREAAVRLGVVHPIVNDRQYRIWRAYAVRAWPTLVVIDPQGIILGARPGEFTADLLAPYIERVIEAYERTGEIDRRPLHFPHDEPGRHPQALRYPGKVAVDGDRMAIADTGNHRVLVGRLEHGGRRLRVERALGSGQPEFADGVDSAAAFDSPQGVAFARDAHGRVLYVADTENHAVRRIALETGSVTTIAGVGHQLRTERDLAAGALSSPWDLTVADTGDTRTLFVAMAGTHQLYAIDLASGAIRAHSGSGAEEIHDAPHQEAALAQPMGIVAAADALYVADAESSAIRRADTAARGRVETIVGTGLFDFGDRDGVGDEVRLEHPQGLALHPDGRLLVADSYNDALKWIDPRTRSATTWVRGFAEPSGVAIGGALVYVADTNAHRIAVVDDAGAVETLEIVS